MFFIKMISFILHKYQLPMICLVLTLLAGCGTSGTKSMSLGTSKNLPDQSEPAVINHDEGAMMEKLTMSEESTSDHTEGSSSKNSSVSKKSKSESFTENEGSSAKKSMAEKQDDELKELLK